MDLFTHSTQNETQRPLAERLRPKASAEFVGLAAILKKHPFLKGLLQGEGGYCPNLIFWGPPGSGKTSLARLISQVAAADFVAVNAIDTGAKDLRDLAQKAYEKKVQFQRSTLLFVDEIHRLNRAQQDVLLPATEKGDFSLIGATTENPSYALNSALLSRCRVVVLNRLGEADLAQILESAAQRLHLPLNSLLTSEAQSALCRLANGDARQLLGFFEILLSLDEGLRPVSDISPFVEGQFQFYDKQADEHYDCISAFIKSIRGSDPDAGLYYLARMLEGGEDPRFIARRLVILASEDVGNADPQALPLAVAGMKAVELVGLPEAAINLAQVVTYLACALKSNCSYMGLRKAQALVKETGNLGIPKSLRSAQTNLARRLGHGEGYKYSHDYEGAHVPQNFLPEALTDKIFYEPSDRGYEAEISRRLESLKKK